MKPPMSRRLLAASVAAASCLALDFRDRAVAAHGPDARHVEQVVWPKPHVTKVLAVQRSELGLSGSKVPVAKRTVGGRSCIVGTVVAIDVDDRFAYDIDEPVDLSVTYAPEGTGAFAVAWDKNAGDGYGVSGEIAPEPGASLRTATVTLDRARFSGQGIQGTDVAVGGRNGIVLCDLELTRRSATKAAPAMGRLQLTVKDAGTGRLVPARVGMYDETGRTPLPSTHAALVHRFADEIRLFWLNRRSSWPSPNRQAFYVNGTYDAEVPQATYDLVVTRGLEYRTSRTTVHITAGSNPVSVSLQRYANLPAAGWYSGDSHVHHLRERADDLAIWTMAAAEDVHMTHLLEMGNISRTHFRQSVWGRAGRFVRDDYALLSGQEDPRTVQRGHTIHWGLDRHSRFDQEAFFQYHRVFERTRQQGALTGYAHLGQGFNGQRGLALDVPFGLVDFIEVLQGGRLNTDIWYSFLNLGYRIFPVAGADFPYFGPTQPGVERTFVKVQGPFSIDGWLAGARRGATYVTNGPLLDFAVDGQPTGAEIRVKRGTTLDIAASARLNPDVDRLDRLELVVLGDVSAQESAAGRDRVDLRHQLQAERSMWIAVRAYGSQQEAQFTTVAHSAPIYIVVDGQPTWKSEAVPQLVQRQRALLDDLLTRPIDPQGDLETWETEAALLEQWPLQRKMLEPRVAEARAKYQQLLDKARALASP